MGEEIAQSFLAHLDASPVKISRAQFEENLLNKIKDPIFVADLEPLLAGATEDFDFEEGLDLVMTEIVGKLPGEPWKGGSEK